MAKLTELFLFLTVPALIAGSGWDYDNTGANGPSSWSGSYADCGGSGQSPIDITGAVYNADLGSITFTGYDSPDASTDYILTNNGHSATVSMGNSSLTISGGGLNGTYRVAQFHFHWGSSSSTGSEHTIEGEMYAAELHIVHYKTDYGSFTSALPEPDGLAVLGIMIEEEGSSNSAFTEVTDELSNVEYPTSSEVTITKFALEDLLPDDLDHFYRYNGSLTTPPCYESVTWTVFGESVKMSTAQLTALRSIFQDDNTTAIVDNYRPVQPLNSRTIYMSWESSGAGETCIMSFSLILLISVLAASSKEW